MFAISWMCCRDSFQSSFFIRQSQTWDKDESSPSFCFHWVFFVGIVSPFDVQARNGKNNRLRLRFISCADFLKGKLWFNRKTLRLSSQTSYKNQEKWAHYSPSNGSAVWIDFYNFTVIFWSPARPLKTYSTCCSCSSWCAASDVQADEKDSSC